MIAFPNTERESNGDRKKQRELIFHVDLFYQKHLTPCHSETVFGERKKPKMMHIFVHDERHQSERLDWIADWKQHGEAKQEIKNLIKSLHFKKCI